MVSIEWPSLRLLPETPSNFLSGFSHSPFQWAQFRSANRQLFLKGCGLWQVCIVNKVRYRLGVEGLYSRQRRSLSRDQFLSIRTLRPPRRLNQPPFSTNLRPPQDFWSHFLDKLSWPRRPKQYPY